MVSVDSKASETWASERFSFGCDVTCGSALSSDSLGMSPSDPKDPASELRIPASGFSLSVSFALFRWRTSPEGSISLTKKSVYLEFPH